ncbi:photosynthetic reaction center cytochrome PufC [Methylocystis parvus]|uniref:photosynthetic reaction center cytochrome PufC n=1 Tax=Methylocystis parvus TaxID=134 RepID=UPI003C71AD21
MNNGTGLRLTLSLVGGVTATLLTVAMLFTAGWVRPPIFGVQTGYRGTGQEQLISVRDKRLVEAANALPDAIDKAAPGGEPATKAYKNVKILTDLNTEEFNRVMVAITQWVSPDQGCAYCHNTENLADDDLYTKIVARRMLDMNRHINKNYKSHVADTGVTCYTCHRGQPVPSNIWFENPGAPHAGGMSAHNYGFGHPAKSNGATALPVDPLTPHLLGDDNIRVEGKTALPTVAGASIQQTEQSFSLMIHMSEALGVNCTFCHSSRNFGGWDESKPQRTVAWHGLEMMRELNAVYLEPLKASYPAHRLGSQGDAPKANCATCHQGVSKPLLGQSMAKDFPELGGKATP